MIAIKPARTVSSAGQSFHKGDSLASGRGFLRVFASEALCRRSQAARPWPSLAWSAVVDSQPQPDSLWAPADRAFRQQRPPSGEDVGWVMSALRQHQLGPQRPSAEA
ncbi:MAG: hypothetical protein R3E56_15775 [Burkholderiaceae bacterium]